MRIVLSGALLLSLASCASAFPKDFAWGAATAAYQIEGAYKEGGRGLSIWDTFSHTPGKTANGDTGDVADDSYHRFEQDIALAQQMGITHYRFSIAWSRILPNGDFPVNKEGVEFYNKLINTLISKGIEPFVTLYHWDLPQALEDKYEGWLDERSVAAFSRYAEVCFLNFGDRVKNWLTFNEPLTFVGLGYAYGIHAPGRCSDRSRCAKGNSGTEPYIVAHNVLKAHGRAVAIYRELKQATDKILDGKIGITLNVDWAEPLTNSQADKDAAERLLQFNLAWFADPVFFGKYPDVMVQNVGGRLPSFTAEESALIKGSWDFFGLNHYTSKYAAQPNWGFSPGSYDGDTWVATTTTGSNGKPIGVRADSEWLYVVPWGFRSLLNWVAERYGNPGIFVTENGCDVPDESSLPLDKALKDDFRVDFYKEYIGNMSLAIEDGVDVRGYFAWSLLDNFEWADGYSKRFGLHYVDYKDGLKRYAKDSAKWYKQHIFDSSRRHRPLLSGQGPTQDGAAPVLPPPERSFKTEVGVLGSLVGLAALAVLVSALLMARTLLRRRRTPSVVDLPGPEARMEDGASRPSDLPYHDDEDDEAHSVKSDLLSPRGALAESAPRLRKGSRSTNALSVEAKAAAMNASRSAGQLSHEDKADESHY